MGSDREKVTVVACYPAQSVMRAGFHGPGAFGTGFNGMGGTGAQQFGTGYNDQRQGWWNVPRSEMQSASPGDQGQTGAFFPAHTGDFPDNFVYLPDSQRVADLSQSRRFNLSSGSMPSCTYYPELTPTSVFSGIDIPPQEPAILHPTNRFNYPRMVPQPAAPMYVPPPMMIPNQENMKRKVTGRKKSSAVSERPMPDPKDIEPSFPSFSEAQKQYKEKKIVRSTGLIIKALQITGDLSSREMMQVGGCDSKRVYDIANILVKLGIVSKDPNSKQYVFKQGGTGHPPVEMDVIARQIRELEWTKQCLLDELARLTGDVDD